MQWQQSIQVKSCAAKYYNDLILIQDTVHWHVDLFIYNDSRIMLGMDPTNERQRYTVMSSLVVGIY